MGAPFIQRTHYEIARYSGGALVGQPQAQEEAAYMARGNLLDDKGTRAPGTPVFELDADEPEQDGLYIRRVITKTEASVF